MDLKTTILGDKQSGKILSNEAYNFLRMDPRGLGHMLFEKLAEHGNDVMQINTVTGEKDTFENFRQRCIRTALHMKSKGLGPQDKITICTHNTLNAPVPLISSILIGVIPSTLDPSFSLDDFKYYIQIIKPKAMFVASEIEPLIMEAIKSNNLDTELIVFDSSFNDFLKPIEGEKTFVPFLPLSIRDTVLILFSSGTTGVPKAICLSHFSFCLFVAPARIKSHRNYILPFSSLHWISQVGMTFSNIVHGSIKLICPTFDNPQTFCDIAREYNLRMATLTPYRLMVISDYCIQNGVTLPLNNIIIAGAPLTKGHIEIADKAFPNAKLTNVYGQTEVPNISFFPLNEKHEEKFLKGSCGKIGPGITLRIVNVDTEETLGPHQEGEIRVRSPMLMNGYYGLDSLDVYDSQGWFRTGDIGYYDDDEFLYIAGRCKEMIRYKSFPINPAVLENVILQHPAVQECVVTGVPHEIDGDHPVAFVTLKQGYEVDPNEIKKFVDERVEDRKKLRGGVIVIDKIPLTVTEKIQRRVLKEMLQNLKAQ